MNEGAPKIDANIFQLAKTKEGARAILLLLPREDRKGRSAELTELYSLLETTPNLDPEVKTAWQEALAEFI